jgi:hypothetical protein
MKSRHFGRQTHGRRFARASDAARGVARCLSSVCFDLALGSALFYQPVLISTAKFGEETPGHPIEGAEEHRALAVQRFRHLNHLARPITDRWARTREIVIWINTNFQRTCGAMASVPSTPAFGRTCERPTTATTSTPGSSCWAVRSPSRATISQRPLARSIGRSPPAELQQGACWSRALIPRPPGLSANDISAILKG